MKLKFLSSTSLKIIAIFVMFIDHLAAVNREHKELFFSFDMLGSNGYDWMRLFGRLAFPIFAFLISEGYYYTRSKKKYLIRLGIFALVSEVAFDLAFFSQTLEFTHQNIFFTLFLGLIALMIYDHFKNEDQAIVGWFLLILIGILADILKTDYGLYGILYIFIFYLFRNDFKKILLSVIMINIVYLFLLYWLSQFFSIFSLVIIYFYNHKKGKNLKYLFYVFYPLHLFLLYLATILLKG